MWCEYNVELDDAVCRGVRTCAPACKSELAQEVHCGSPRPRSSWRRPQCPKFVCAGMDAQLLSVQLASLLGQNTCSVDDFDALNYLGQGAHSMTRIVRRKHDGHILCRKEIPLDRVPDGRTSEVLREVEILMMLDGHPHVIGFIGACIGGGNLNIVQEYAEGGTLAQRLDARRERQEPLHESEPGHKLLARHTLYRDLWWEIFEGVGVLSVNDVERCASRCAIKISRERSSSWWWW